MAGLYITAALILCLAGAAVLFHKRRQRTLAGMPRADPGCHKKFLPLHTRGVLGGCASRAPRLVPAESQV